MFSLFLQKMYNRARSLEDDQSDEAFNYAALTDHYGKDFNAEVIRNWVTQKIISPKFTMESEFTGSILSTLIRWEKNAAQRRKVRDQQALIAQQASKVAATVTIDPNDEMPEANDTSVIRFFLPGEELPPEDGTGIPCSFF